MAKKTPAPLSLRASVHIGRGIGRRTDGPKTGHTPGWTGDPVEVGDTLTTTDGALHANLVRLGYGTDLTASS